MTSSFPPDSPTTVHCDDCGEPLPMDAPAGFCPTCLIRGGISAIDAQPPLPQALPSELQAGDRIQDRYTVMEKLGEGGFGVVYRARQTSPLRRDVALKVLKAGMDTVQVVRRFDAEKQALARIDHPNIATVYDAGETDAGRPFFVMELVRGMPITEYAELQKLSLRERLVLIKHVCEALHHAHEKGIVHRDLKPSNILLAGNGLPKVIDFGIAKALDEPLSTDTLVTMETQVIGTPTYMSPEQAVPGQNGVDARADVYALGVVLYELLVGETPYDRDQLYGRSPAELAEFYQTHLPSKPSLAYAKKLKSGTSDTTTMSASRIPADLDWIAMKALEADPKRRYETAGAMAEDLTRHLNDEPISARPPKPSYRFWKFLRRRRTPVLSMLGLAMATVVGWAGGAMVLEAKATVPQAVVPAPETSIPYEGPAAVRERVKTPENLAESRQLLEDSLQQVNTQPEAFGVWGELQHAHMHLGHRLAAAGENETAADHFRQAYALYYMPMGRVSQTAARRAGFAASNAAKCLGLDMEHEKVADYMFGERSDADVARTFGLTETNATRLEEVLPAVREQPLGLRDLSSRKLGPPKFPPRRP